MRLLPLILIVIAVALVSLANPQQTTTVTTSVSGQPGPAIYLPTISTGDFCAAANTFYNNAFASGAAAPTVDTVQASGPLTCSSLPFSGWIPGSQGGELRLTVPINTDWPFLVPTKFSIHGNLQGDCSSNNAAICPTATFRSNFPAVQGCTSTCAATTATVAFNTNSNAVLAGTNVAGTPTVGGTGSFTGGACSTVTPGKLCGYNLSICPATVALCIPSSSINLGRVVSVTDTTHLTLETNVHSPITIPTAGTGYQYVFIMPVVQMTTIGNSPACSGSGNACISNNQEITRVAVDANDGASDLHTCYVNLVGQEGVGTDRLLTRSCRWEGYDIETTGAQNSGPYINVRIGGNANISGVISLPMMVWQVGYMRPIIGASLVTSQVEPVNMIIANQINQGGFNVEGDIHYESAADGAQCGNATVWPWAGTGTGCQHIKFDGLSGNATLTTAVHVLNNGIVDDVEIGTIGCGGATSAIVNDLIPETIPCGSQEKYFIGATRFSSGLNNLRSATLALAVGAITANTCAAAQTVTITGLTTNSKLSWNYAATPIGVTGYGVGGLQITTFPTANTANVVVCNITAASITPGAISVRVSETSI